MVLWTPEQLHAGIYSCLPGELRRHRRFDHSPGNYWRTQLLPEEDGQTDGPKAKQLTWAVVFD